LCGCIEMVREWSSKLLLLYVNGRAEVVFTDGSAIIVHPGAERLSFFRQDGVRQRCLKSCMPWNCALPIIGHKDPKVEAVYFGKDEVCAKASAALNLRGRFCAFSSVGPLQMAQRTQRQVRVPRARWPPPSIIDDVQEISANIDITVSSADSAASLTLAGHGRTYAVVWWQPQEISNCLHCVKTSKGLYQEHVQRQQCFTVADPPLAAWVYPLFLALSQHRLRRGKLCAEADVSFIDARIAVIAALMRGQVTAGEIIEGSDGEILAKLPCTQVGLHANNAQGMHDNMWGNDVVSPAAALGAAGEGPVHVSWTPDSTAWFHVDYNFNEVTIDASGSGNIGHRLIVSSQGGLFWTHSWTGGEEVFASSALPSGGNDSVLWYVLEAQRWLRHNRTEMACRLPTGLDDGTLSEKVHVDVACAASWIRETKMRYPGLGCISVFRPRSRESAHGLNAASASSPQRLLRFLFDDATRLSFVTQRDSSGGLKLPGGCSTFRLLSSTGAIMTRSFKDPSDCAVYAQAALELVRRLTMVPDTRESQLLAARLTEGERRRVATMHRLHAALTAFGTSDARAMTSAKVHFSSGG